MAKKRKKRTTNRCVKASSPSRKKVNGSIVWVVLIVAVTVIGLLLSTDLGENFVGELYDSSLEKDGELTFHNGRTSGVIKKINIEIADDDSERVLGLMYRRHMKDSSGMLFIMDKEEPQAFWMKNTYISLDIIYLNKNLEIVKIYKDTIPFSEKPLRSHSSSKYVVEVNAGFCNKHMIKTGDYIKFRK